MLLSRSVVRIRGKANEALSLLSKRSNLSPNLLIEKLLIHTANSSQDDELFKKELFALSIIFQIELPFCFPYEFEEFEFRIADTRARLYLERIPKRYVIDRLPFRTMATSIIELTSEEERFAYANEKHITRDKMGAKYSVLSYNLLKNLIISLRRITGDYYNIGVIEPPMNFEEFQKKVKMSIVFNMREYSTSGFMPIKEDSWISVGQKLNEELHSAIVDSAIRKLNDRGTDFLADSNEYLDAARVFYYQENWNLCLLNSVIAMESGLASLVFNSATTKFYLNKASGSLDILRKVYKEKVGLPKRIEGFLFPVIQELGLSEVLSSLKNMMPSICNKKTEDGIYDQRSKVLHEGVSIGRDKAEKSVEVSSEFLKILNSINENDG